ncbi:hypothetical protein TNCV_2106481 [Trichonephila clavipes]|nr:hypothetical protein TNCV_2106481 [Trichonephila clavipes]
MRHAQEKHKMRMKKEQKCLPEERCKRMNEQNQLLSEEQEKLSDEDMEVPQAIEKVFVFRTLISAEDETYEEKGETPVDVIKDKAKGDVDPVILSKQQVDLDYDEMGEELSEITQKLSRMAVAKLQQTVDLKASSNIILIPERALEF